MRGLAGKTVIVAGAGSGIGAATAVRLAEEGASVVVGDLHAENARAVAGRIRAEGAVAVAVPFDIVDEASVDRLVARTLETFGGLHGVHINVADLSPQTLERDTDVLTLPLDVFDRTIRVDLRGHVLVTRRVLPELLRGWWQRGVHGIGGGIRRRPGPGRLRDGQSRSTGPFPPGCVHVG